MKKIFILATFLIGVLFLACNNNFTPQNSTSEDKQDTIPALLFTPEEIAYNDSIRDRVAKKNAKITSDSLSLVLIIEQEYIDKKNFDEIKKRELKYKESYKSLEEAYLSAYDYFCAGVISAYYVVKHIPNASWEEKSVAVKLLDDNGIDIIPFINIEDIETKEYKTWIERLEDYKRLTPKHQHIDDFKQPIVEKGKPMYLSFP